jgi:hypothetical protein
VTLPDEGQRQYGQRRFVDEKRDDAAVHAVLGP